MVKKDAVHPESEQKKEATKDGNEAAKRDKPEKLKYEKPRLIPYEGGSDKLIKGDSGLTDPEPHEPIEFEE